MPALSPPLVLPLDLNRQTCRKEWRDRLLPWPTDKYFWRPQTWSTLCKLRLNLSTALSDLASVSTFP